LSAFTILTFLFFLSRYIEPASIMDISALILKDEVFIFNNIKEKAMETVRISKSCEELEFNLEEYKMFAEKFAGMGGKLLLSYHLLSPCEFGTEEIPTVVEFNLTLISEDAELTSTFYETWTPS
jgi:hypothetical protein